MKNLTAKDPSSGWAAFYGPNEGYAIERYEQYLQDPGSIDEKTRELFDRLGPPPAISRPSGPARTPGSGAPAGSDPDGIRTRAAQFAQNIREYGHLAARIHPFPLPRENAPVPGELDMRALGLDRAALSELPADVIPNSGALQAETALDAILRLEKLYTGTMAFDFGHVNDPGERDWLTGTIERNALSYPASAQEKLALLKQLTDVEAFEHFLHTTFPGQKRFSIEGVDALVPMLDAVVAAAARQGAREVLIGMAHRGRLSVLAHLLAKPFTAILAEFQSSPNKEMVPSEGSMGINFGWTGDVKYHLGARRTLEKEKVARVRLTLANNPSHLEFVNPVVQGFARAAQDQRSGPGPASQDADRALAILVHGDASFPGEGIVAETLNLSRLEGYQTGGTVHIIANNAIGFTTEAGQGRSTRYASDLAKGFEIPVVHVNADDPESCVAAVLLAHDYRRKFHKDFLVDLVGYRRYGHSEGDDPTTTQPLLYAAIEKHPSVRRLYAEKLLAERLATPDDIRRMEDDIALRLKVARAETGSTQPVGSRDGSGTVDEPSDSPTGASPDFLREVNRELLARPDGFNEHPKLRRVLERRRDALEKGEVDFGHAETLAFAAILSDGVPIRLSGQDAERGTFSQRHLVLHDVKKGAVYVPLQHLSRARASFSVHNSPLSEAAILGFEYGYNVQAPEALVLWEAQYGDFANAAQVLIDQFIASGQSKWRQRSGLTVLLPHGYEGQGPEHSSARVERFLQLSAAGNWRVATPTTAAQYFHLLRSQAALLRESPRPLIVFTPKSLLRNPLCASSGTELAEGRFQPVLNLGADRSPEDAVRRIVLCSGKIGVDLEAAVRKTEESGGARPDFMAVARVEQLYPFPSAELRALLKRFPRASEVVWLQEEPENMGPWSFMRPRLRQLLDPGWTLRYVGRRESASPAEGPNSAHLDAQKKILETVLSQGAAPVSAHGGNNHE